VTRLPIVVAPLPEAPGEPGERAAAPQDAVSVDLSKLVRTGPTPPEAPTRTAGWISFTSSQPVRGHHVVVRRAKGHGDEAEVFDSRRLGRRSVFAVTLLQPGRYSLRNAIGGAKAEIVVSYPRVGDAPYRPPAPLQIEVTEDGFGAQRFTLSPAQGMVFRFRAESRIQIELVEPDEGPGPAPTRRPRARFAQTPGAGRPRRGRPGA